MPLAVCASLDVFSDLFPHIRPPVVSFYKVYRAIDPWVAVDREVMVVSNQSTSLYVCAGDYSPAIFIPPVFDPFQLVWVYPWLQYLFVLLIYRILLCYILYGEFLSWFFTFELLYSSHACKQVVGEYCNILVIVFSLIIVGSSRECVRASIGGSFDVVNL